MCSTWTYGQISSAQHQDFLKKRTEAGCSFSFSLLPSTETTESHFKNVKEPWGTTIHYGLNWMCKGSQLSILISWIKKASVNQKWLHMVQHHTVQKNDYNLCLVEKIHLTRSTKGTKISISKYPDKSRYLCLSLCNLQIPNNLHYILILNSRLL